SVPFSPSHPFLYRARVTLPASPARRRGGEVPLVAGGSSAPRPPLIARRCARLPPRRGGTSCRRRELSPARRRSSLGGVPACCRGGEAPLLARGSSTPHPRLIARTRRCAAMVAEVVPTTSRSGRGGATWLDPRCGHGGVTRTDPRSCHWIPPARAPGCSSSGFGFGGGGSCPGDLASQRWEPYTSCSWWRGGFRRCRSARPHHLLPTLVSAADVLPVGFPDLVSCNDAVQKAL
ncbi:unnamed protein product, partial [Urochloa humidicola]